MTGPIDKYEPVMPAREHVEALARAGRRRVSRADKWVAAVLFVIVFAVTLAASRTQGVNRDEAYYMEAGEQYVTYFERVFSRAEKHPFADETIKRYWEYNHEHPPLLKVLYGISWRVLHQCDCAAEREFHPGIARLPSGQHHRTLGLTSEITAFRVPTMLFFALLCALVYLFFLEAFGTSPEGPTVAGRAGALAAALLTAAQPRAFFHAQTAGFDLPAAALWFATTYAWWRTLAPGARLRGAILVGVLYGLFLATKLQSFFLPFALLPHLAYVTWRLWLADGPGRRLGALVRRLRPLFAMAIIGPLVFFALWPWLWHDTVHRIGAYVGFHLNHVHYNFEYLGTNYNRPPYPWHEPLGMLLTTAPVVLLALAGAGALLLGRRALAARRGEVPADPRATGALLLLAGFVPLAPFFQGTTPIFGETKHWLATMPILALCAGVAVKTLIEALFTERSLVGDAHRATRAAVAAAVVAVSFAPAAVETARSHPYGLSHYNALAGGAPGGADLGMNRQFWGYSVRGLLPWMNAHLPQNTAIYLHDWNHDAWEMYVRDKLLRADLHDSGMEDPGIRDSSAALVIHEKHFAKYEYMIWNAYGHVQPTTVLTLDGVPLVTLYQRTPPPP